MHGYWPNSSQWCEGAALADEKPYDEHSQLHAELAPLAETFAELTLCFLIEGRQLCGRSPRYQSFHPCELLAVCARSFSVQNETTFWLRSQFPRAAQRESKAT